MIDQALPRRSGIDVPDGPKTTLREYRITATPGSTSGAVWCLSCHYCGFEPEARETRTRCPKCGGSAWELTPVPGSLLSHAAGARADARTESPRLHPDDRDNAYDEEEPDEDVDDRSVDAQPLGSVLFRVRCSASQVYLLFGPEPGRPRMLPLHQVQHDEWQMRLCLPPGVYRYRFYVDDGTRLVYFATSDLTGNASHTLDGRLLVPRLRSGQ